MQFFKFAYFLFSCLILAQSASKKDDSLYGSLTSIVMKLSRRNFEAQITTARQKTVSVVHFFRKGDGASLQFAPEYEQFAVDMKGIFKVAAVDCDEEYEVCEKERIAKTPLVRVYPPAPVPSFDHEGEINTKAIAAEAGRYVQSIVLEINSTNVAKFTQENPSVPKVLLFTDKKGIPLLFKALSTAFEKKLFFGIVRNDQQEVFDEYAVKGTPQIIVVRSTERKPIVYSGELKFQALFDFLNVYSEAFVAGGENMDASKPWLKELVPELSSKSANDVCFKTEGGLCVIIVSKGTPEKHVVDVIEEVQRSSKGATSNYRFMWLNADVQTEFTTLFNVQEYPKVVVLSPGKRKKFLIHEGEIEASKLENTFEVINNGDARFNHIRTELPEFSQ